MKQQRFTFEQFRNKTNFYEFLDRWNKHQKKIFDSDPRLKAIFGNFYQYQTLRYIGGVDMPVPPRGLLMYHQMGSGKTIESIASSLYAVNTLPQYQNSRGVARIVFILNRNLLIKTQQEIVKYVKMLNRQKLSLDLKSIQQPINPDEVLKEFHFIVMNDPVNFSDKFDALFGINDQLPRLIIFDEAHNLTRSIINGNKKGADIYNTLVNNQHIQILLLTGSAMGKEPAELAFCFQILSGNKKLFGATTREKPDGSYEVNADFNEFFLTKHSHLPLIKHKDIFVKRIAGLTSFVQMDLQGTQAELWPTLKETENISVKITDKDQVHMYNQERKNEKGFKGQKADQFMQRSRIALDGVNRDGIIRSSKFKRMKQTIEDNYGKVQIIFSNFVESGVLAFAKYCEQDNPDSKYKWRKFIPGASHKGPNDIIYAEIHGDVEFSMRQAVLDVLVQPSNNYGAHIDVILLSPASIEGINTRHVRIVHIMEPQWQETTIEQVIYRAVRRGSHTDLQPHERNVTPYMYLGYVDKEIDMKNKIEVRDNKSLLSSDQIVYYKSNKRAEIVREFCILLQLGSISCADYKDLIIKSIRDRLSEKQQINPCFKCSNNGKTLFNPTNIHEDLKNHDCLSDYKDNSSNKIMINHVAYSWFVDIYSTPGLRIYEVRSNGTKYVDEDSDLFRTIYDKILLPQNNVIQEDEEEVKEIDQLKPTMPVTIIDSKHKLAKNAATINLTDKPFSKLLASKMMVDVCPLNEKLGQSPFYHAIELMEMHGSVEQTLEKIKIDLQKPQRIKAYPIPSDNGQKYLFMTKIIPSQRLYQDLMYPLYSAAIDLQFGDLIDKQLSLIKEQGHILLIRKSDTTDYDIQLLIQKLRQRLDAI